MLLANSALRNPENAADVSSMAESMSTFLRFRPLGSERLIH